MFRSGTVSTKQNKRTIRHGSSRKGRAIGPTLVSASFVATSLRRFAKDRSGDAAIMFGLLAMSMFLMIGGAVDLGRWLHARSETRSGVDAAVLAGARALQTNGLNETEAMAAAQAFYDENIKNRPPVDHDTITFKVTDSGTSVTAEGSAALETTFLKLIGIDSLPLLKLAGTEYGEATLAVGANAEQSLEISLMLDVTGSMDGQKLDDMKAAAKDLIDIVVWEGSGEYTSRVALVPFAEAVNLGSMYNSVVKDTGPSYMAYQLGTGYWIWWWRAANCISERSGTHAYTDKKPEAAQDKFAGVYRWDGACLPSNPIVPLSSDKQMLKNTIDGFTASGGTAGHIGTAWAWYMLSPKFEDVVPAESKPAGYGKLEQTNSEGKPILQKIAVLMTDGEYNAEYCDNGIRAKRPGAESYTGNCDPVNDKSAEQARQLCQNMKDAGITIYTVGFQLAEGGEAEETMTQCATSPDHVYDADNGQELKQSFRDIALKISDLYLSK